MLLTMALAVGMTPMPDVLVFSKTAGFRHGSIESGAEAIATLAKGKWNLVLSEDSNECCLWISSGSQSQSESHHIIQEDIHQFLFADKNIFWKDAAQGGAFNKSILTTRIDVLDSPCEMSAIASQHIQTSSCHLPSSSIWKLHNHSYTVVIEVPFVFDFDVWVAPW